MDTLHLTLRMTTAEPVETSVTTTCNNLSQDYTNLDDHISQTSILHLVWRVNLISGKLVNKDVILRTFGSLIILKWHDFSVVIFYSE